MICSSLRGTDILFLEAMLELWCGDTYFSSFLPKKNLTENAAVRRVGGNWVSRPESVLDQATSVHYVTKDGYNGEDTFFILQ